MTETLATFDDDVIDAVAAESDIAPADLRALVRRHQESVQDLPGVDDLVYEWRKLFPDDPLVERREDAFLLVVDEWVWPEFEQSLSLSDEERQALQAVHERQLRADVADVPEDGEAIILVRA